MRALVSAPAGLFLLRRARRAPRPERRGIAGLLHLIDGRGDEAVEAAVVDRAIEIGRFLIPHAQAAYAFASALAARR